MGVIATVTLTACGGGGDADSSTANALESSATATVNEMTESHYPNEAGATATASVESTDVATTASADEEGDSDHREHALATATMVPAGGTTGAGTATINWAAPSTKANGTTVGALAGYRIYFGTASGKYTSNLFVSGSTAVTGTVSGLASGKWYFTVAAVDSSGYESNLGYELSKTL